MRANWILWVAATVAFVSLALAGAALVQRFNQGEQTRRAICKGQNQVRKVLRDEHAKKLQEDRAYLAKHPNGAPAIGVSRGDLLKAIREEQNIVRRVSPLRCK